MDVVRKAVEKGKMAYTLRPMEHADIRQAQEVERDAFPTLWPTTHFRKELSNRIAKYLVAYERINALGSDSALPVTTVTNDDISIVGRLLGKVRDIFGENGRHEQGSNGDRIVGIVGTWHMVDEAHIATIGVRSADRRKGIGELLLIGCIEQAIARRSKVVTLEVRVSNKEAQALYYKYGFREAGLRKRYYSDNNEDALIMTTSPILEESYRERFRSLVEAHTAKWGESERALS